MMSGKIPHLPMECFWPQGQETRMLPNRVNLIYSFLSVSAFSSVNSFNVFTYWRETKKQKTENSRSAS